MDHVLQAANVVEERPDLPFSRGGSGDGGEPADIVWVNRSNSTTNDANDTDGFGRTFGTSAPLARAVVDAVIASYERMIGSFNYATPGATYSLSVNMSSGGFGASASLTGSLAGKPKSGMINMGRGNSTTDPNDDNNWFLDPTPNDSAEFLGNIVNAYSGDASVAPATTRGDFYTIFAAELTHCMGLFGNSLPGWAALTSDTGIPDTAEAGSNNTGVGGTFYVFNGPSIKHLLTSNNGGPNGFGWGSAIHSAGPATITYNGDTYAGGQDQGNAIYEFGRRYTVNNIFALMFKDAYGYSTVDPARDGTFYSVLNSTNGVLTVRGAPASDDSISITRSGSTITVSVDIQNDVPGTGALPGPGDLPAFVSVYDASQLTSISIKGDSGNDTITLGSDLGLPVSVAGDAGTDALTLQGDAGNNAFFYGGTTTPAGATNITSLDTVESFIVDGGAGNDQLTLIGTPALDVFTLSGNNFTGRRTGAYAGLESVRVQTLESSDVVFVNASDASVLIDVGSTGDDVYLFETQPAAPAFLLGGTDVDLAHSNITLNTDNQGSASLIINTDATLASLATGAGATLDGIGSISVSNTFEAYGGRFTGTGTLHVLSTATTARLGGGDFAVQLERRFISDIDVLIDGGPFGVSGASVSNGLSFFSAAFVVAGLTFANLGRIDLGNNSAVIDYTGASPLAAIGSALTTGYNGGAWNGRGINSASAAANSGGTRTLGYAEAVSIFPGPFPATFNGVSVDSTSILIRYTVPGDANLDGAVGFDDLLITAQNYGQSGRIFGNGDFNYDAAVGFDDLLILAQHYGTSALAAADTLITARTPAIAPAKRQPRRNFDGSILGST